MNYPILYLEKGNRSTIIHYANNIVEEQPHNIDSYLNILCLNELTTLEGRIKALKYKFNLIKSNMEMLKDTLAENGYIFSANVCQTNPKQDIVKEFLEIRISSR